MKFDILVRHLLFEDASSQEKSATNILKKANITNIDEILDQLKELNIPHANNRSAKNNGHLPDLAKLYIDSGYNYDTLKREYDVYMGEPKLHTKPLGRFSGKFLDFVGEVHRVTVKAGIYKGADMDSKEAIWEDDSIIVYLGDSMAKCIKYGKGDRYGLCISRENTKRNMFWDYRPTMSTYFVYFKKEITGTEKMPLCGFIIVDRDEDENYRWTSATDERGNLTNDEEVLSIPELIISFPELENAIDKDVFKYHPLTKTELLGRELLQTYTPNLHNVSYEEMYSALKIANIMDNDTFVKNLCSMDGYLHSMHMDLEIMPDSYYTKCDKLIQEFMESYALLYAISDAELIGTETLIRNWKRWNNYIGDHTIDDILETSYRKNELSKVISVLNFHYIPVRNTPVFYRIMVKYPKIFFEMLSNFTTWSEMSFLTEDFLPKRVDVEVSKITKFMEENNSEWATFVLNRYIHNGLNNYMYPEAYTSISDDELFHTRGPANTIIRKPDLWYSMPLFFLQKIYNWTDQWLNSEIRGLELYEDDEERFEQAKEYYTDMANSFKVYVHNRAQQEKGDPTFADMMKEK